MYPEKAKELSEANAEMSMVIWKAFSSATWLHKFFPFSFTADFNKFAAGELDGEFEEGSDPENNTQNPL